MGDAADIVVDVFDTFDLTYLIDRIGNIAALSNAAAQGYLAPDNRNVETGGGRIEYRLRPGLDQPVGQNGPGSNALLKRRIIRTQVPTGTEPVLSTTW